MYYDQATFIETASGNKVCRKSVLCGSQNIMLHGKVGVLVFWLCNCVDFHSVASRRPLFSKIAWFVAIWRM